MVSLKSWRDEADTLRGMGVRLPAYDVAAAKRAGLEQPRWIHFGGGNLYRAFHAEVADDALDAGALDRGVVVVETFSPFTVDEVYAPLDGDILQVVMNEDGTLSERVLASTAGAFFCNPARPDDCARVRGYFESDELQLATFTITEKGYGLRDAAGGLLPHVAREMEAGPEGAASTMGIVAALLLARYRAGAAPLALVSTDNFSRNGATFREAVLTVARGWQERGHVPAAFVDWLADERQVSFPWSMIDRITPNPSPETEAALAVRGWEGMGLVTSGATAFAAFANTERCRYLVVEDSFPNGCPALEEAGVILCARDVVDRADTMKVTACLNPLHTCLAIFGCLLGHTRIWQEMEDANLAALVRKLGYDEDLPVVVSPGVIDPERFIGELLAHRLSNRNLPDAPQRIATDTSQKMPIRFGHTIRAYLAAGKGVEGLTAIPLTIAGWLRYLMGVDDAGRLFEPSPDPLLGELRAAVSGLRLGRVDAEAIHKAAAPVLGNAELFGVDLYEAGLGEKVEALLAEMLTGPGAVAATIEKYVTR